MIEIAWPFIEMVELTNNIKIARLLQQQIDIGKIVRNQQLGISHKIQNVPKHAPIAIDEIVLLQRVQHNRNGAIEQFG